MTNIRAPQALIDHENMKILAAEVSRMGPVLELVEQIAGAQVRRTLSDQMVAHKLIRKGTREVIDAELDRDSPEPETP